MSVPATSPATPPRRNAVRSRGEYESTGAPRRPSVERSMTAPTGRVLRPTHTTLAVTPVPRHEPMSRRTRASRGAVRAAQGRALCPSFGYTGATRELHDGREEGTRSRGRGSALEVHVPARLVEGGAVVVGE